MEHMHKLVATPSSEAQRAFADYTVDRLSDLPLDVALHIPSFLNFKDLIRLSSVSKRCREFYLRTPSLKFSSLGTGNRQRQLNLMNCIDRYMACRRNDPIKCFRICWDLCGGLSEESFRMLTWILIAVRCNVEVLHLRIRNICNIPVLELSHYIFRCGSLKSLTIDIDTILTVPSFAFFSNLQFLKLANVILDEGFGKWISCSCKSIKELHLNSVKVKEFTIDSSSLESFTVEPCYDFYHLSISGVKLARIKIEWRFYDTSVSTTRSLNVKAPNLKYFQWVGNLLNYQNLGKLMSLEKARIFLKHKGDDYDMDNAVKVLCSLCRVKALILSEETTKVLLREGSMHAPLDEIKYLGLHIMSLTDDLVPGVVSLLRGMPNLKTLYINSYPSLQRVGKSKACGFNRKYWKTQNLDCVHQLQEVSIALSLGYTNNALELARYILEHAPNLKKMVICCLSRQFFVEEKVKKMKKLSSAAVVFMEREVDEHDRMGESYYWDLHRFKLLFSLYKKEPKPSIMEHKNKILEPASCEEGASANAVDRLSNVPRKVAHHILSFLGFRDLIRLGSLSKRCAEFCLSTPWLKVSDIGNKQIQFRLLNSVDRYMARRSDDKIKNFCIKWSFYAGVSEECFRVMTWIIIAVRCNVEELEVELSLSKSDRSTLEFPYCIFTCGSLRYLSIRTHTILKAPSFACSSNLQHLKLQKVELDDGFGKWISCSCKCIKEIWLERIRLQNFTVESSSLESFIFRHPYSDDSCQLSISGEKLSKVILEWKFFKTEAGTTRSLNIFAPNLKYLKWIGNLLSYQNLGKFMCLETAHIFLKRERNDYDFGNAFGVLCSLCSAKALVLSEGTAKVLLGDCTKHAPLDDITYLNMHIRSFTDDLVPAMASLLRGMPNLNTLHIDSYPSVLCWGKPKTHGFKRKYWENQKLEFIHHVQEVSIALSNGYPTNALELARYVLEHAPKLKKMVIFYLPHQAYVIEKVNKIKIISYATVVFQKREANENKTMGEDCHWNLKDLEWGF